MNWSSLKDEIEEARPSNNKVQCPWRAAVDPRSGRTYYYHKSKKEATWVKPVDFVEDNSGHSGRVEAIEAVKFLTPQPEEKVDHTTLQLDDKVGPVETVKYLTPRPYHSNNDEAARNDVVVPQVRDHSDSTWSDTLSAANAHIGKDNNASTRVAVDVEGKDGSGEAGFAMALGKFTPADGNNRDASTKAMTVFDEEEEEEIRAIAEGNDIDTEDMDLPEDIFTMMLLAPCCSQAFLLAFFFLGIQVAVLGLALYDLMDDGGEDNGNTYNVPSTTNNQIIAAQYVSLFLAVLIQDDLTNALLLVRLKLCSVTGKFHITDENNEEIQFGAKPWQFWLSNTARFFEGGFTLFVCAVFVLNSPTVVDILKDFAAIAFVSEIDDLGFRLGAEGWFGRTIKKSTERMAEKKFAIKGRKSERGHLKGRWVSDINFVSQGLLLAIMVVLFLWHGRTWQKQNNGEYIYRDLCYVLDVGFGNDVLPKELQFELIDGNVTSSNQEPILASTAHPDLHYSYFSGKYYAVEAKMEKDWIPKGLDAARPFYTQASDFSIDMEDTGVFYYCSKQKAWVWTLRAFAKGSNATFSPLVPEETRLEKYEGCPLGWLMKSPKTEAARLEDVPTDGWKVYKGGIFDNAAALSVGCIKCDTDTDCGGVKRGQCVTAFEYYMNEADAYLSDERSKTDLFNLGKSMVTKNDELKVCSCAPTSGGKKYQGDYCTVEPPCDHLVTSSQDRQLDSLPFHIDESFSLHGRPMYVIDSAFETTEYTRVVLYTGRRWTIASYSIEPVDLLLLAQYHDELDAYTKYLSANFTSFGESWYSEPTTSFAPTGNLAWYSTTTNGAEAMDESNFFRTGIELNISFECAELAGRSLLQEKDEEL